VFCLGGGSSAFVARQNAIGPCNPAMAGGL
jgi:hypothetical protein